MTVQPLIQPRFGKRESGTHRPRWAVFAAFAAIAASLIVLVRYLRTHVYDPSKHVTLEEELGG